MSAWYRVEEVYENKMITPDFIKETFDMEEDCYVVKPDIRKHIHFGIANALDPNLKDQLGMADIVYAQHFMVHLRKKDAVRAFNNICDLLNPQGVLFVAGVDLDISQKITKKRQLIPLEYKIEEIYDEVGKYGGGWPYQYWANEPFKLFSKDWKRRYSTVFLKGVE
jgi:chemotaxis methyl-accepting protein methylase